MKINEFGERLMLLCASYYFDEPSNHMLALDLSIMTWNPMEKLSNVLGFYSTFTNSLSKTNGQILWVPPDPTE